jgi:hypothetical protein
MPENAIAITSNRTRRHLWRRVCAGVAGALLLPLLSWPGAAAKPVTSDPSSVTSWNQIALTTLLADTTKAQDVLLYLGFVDAAMYDAVVGIDGRYEPYELHARGPRGTSDVAAAVTAAHRVLVTYTPTAKTTLDADYAASLAAIPDGPAKTRGIAYGTRAADTLTAARVGDGRNAPILFTQPPAPGVWRPTPPAFLPMAVPWLGAVKPLLVRSGAQFGEPGPPPALTSARYTRDFNESATSTVRTPEQTSTAIFFSGSVIIQVAAATVDQIDRRGLDIVDAVRVLAAVNMSAADALISVWHAKYLYGFWRPITAITLADTDANPNTTADPTWTPLLTTPPYPDYVSGYSGITGAFTQALQETLNTHHLDLVLTSTAAPGTRHYDTGQGMRDDVINARVWLGIHFRTADVLGVRMGQQVADWALDHNFEPLDHR